MVHSLHHHIQYTVCITISSTQSASPYPVHSTQHHYQYLCTYAIATTCMCERTIRIHYMVHRTIRYYYTTGMSLLTVLVEDTVYFYLLFEVMLVVMYTTVSTYWYTSRACYALYMLVIYTIVGSSLMAVSMVMYYTVLGTTNGMHSIDGSHLLPILRIRFTATTHRIHGSQIQY